MERNPSGRPWPLAPCAQEHYDGSATVPNAVEDLGTLPTASKSRMMAGASYAYSCCAFARSKSSKEGMRKERVTKFYLRSNQSLSAN